MNDEQRGSWLHTYTLSSRTKARFLIGWRHELFRNSDGVSLYLIFTLPSKGCSALESWFRIQITNTWHKVSSIYWTKRTIDLEWCMVCWEWGEFQIDFRDESHLLFDHPDTRSASLWRYTQRGTLSILKFMGSIIKSGYVKWQEYIMYSPNRLASM